MSVYDKRRAYKLYSDGRNYVLNSQYIDNEKLLFRVVNSQLYLNKITNDEWNKLLSSKLYSVITESYGCLGLLSQKEPKREYYLVFVKDAASIGVVKETEVFRVTDVFFIHLSNETSSYERTANDDILENNSLNTNSAHFVDVKKFLSNGYFYFSLSVDLKNRFDLTLNSQQRNDQNSKSDYRFFWNFNLHSPLKRLSVDTDQWLLKLICGCVEIKKVVTSTKLYRACIISRLSCERAGTRFNCRGLNDLGSVANFVETEQIIFSEENEECSFTQIRGSLPLFWEQSGFQVGAHKIRLSRAPELCYPAFVKHFKHINYDKCFVLNLLSQKGDEYVLSKYYDELVKVYMKTESKIGGYVHFDYHAELKNLKNQALVSSLWPQIDKWFAQFKQNLYYFKSNEPSKTRTQKFVIRTNCIDCLDRTNNVQLFIGLGLIKNQLVDLGLYDDKTINKFRDVFRQLWLLNGDNISKIYAGTGAIQGKSVTQDIGRSLTRAIQNNFFDSSKQDVIDLLLFNYNKKIYSRYGCEVIERAKVLLNSDCFRLPSYILYNLVNRYKAYTDEITCNLVIATWNINGGLSEKDMRDAELDDWLTRAPLISSDTQLGYLDRSYNFNERNIDVFAIGFEEIVDLNASNIVNASDENSNKWFKKLRDFFAKYDDYVSITNEPLQLVGVCLFVFVKKKHASFIRLRLHNS
jgi:synaptojanin